MCHTYFSSNSGSYNRSIFISFFRLGIIWLLFFMSVVILVIISWTFCSFVAKVWCQFESALSLGKKSYLSLNTTSDMLGKFFHNSSTWTISSKHTFIILEANSSVISSELMQSTYFNAFGSALPKNKKKKKFDNWAYFPKWSRF